MIKLRCNEDCEKAPEKSWLRDFNFAVAEGDFSVAVKYFAEDIIWNLFEPAGQKKIYGRDNVIKEYEQNLVIEPVEFIIDTIISHGNQGAVNGTIKAKDGTAYVFCDVYKFSSDGKSATINEMTSYIIQLDDTSN